MSNSGQAGSAIIGGIIGYVVTGGSPYGALYGAQIGLLAGTLLFPTQLPQVFGPRLEDLTTTTAQLGGPVPIIYGTIAVPGTVIFLACVEERSDTEEMGGKGGPEQEITTYTYFQTIALGLCEGPIAGLLRVWENGELKYDVRPQQDSETTQAYSDRIEMSSEYGAGFVLYLGDEFQEADPTIEMTMGAGEVPAFRGLAYIVYPHRQLKDEQARRHPQFRFEVWQGESEQAVLPPIELTGALDGYQAPYILPDWPRNRYYTVDLVGTEGIRVFDVMTNQELEQVLLADLLAPQPFLSFEAMTIGSDGTLYLCGFISGSTLRLVAVNPTTFEVDGSVALGGAANVPERMCVVRWVGSLQTIDYILMQGLFGAFTVRVANPPGAATIVVDYAEADGLVTDGYRAGTTSYAYGLTWSAALSGTGADVHIYEFVIDEQFGPDLLPFPAPTLTEIATIPLSALDPACTRLTRLEGLFFDETDRCLIFGAQGRGPGSSDPIIFSAFFKYDPELDVIVWRSADLDLENYDDMSHESRLRGGTLAVTQSLTDIAVIDTRTGTHTVREFNAELPNSFTGQSVYDSAHGTVISFVTSNGPYVIFLDRRLPGAVSIASIISDICARCGLAEDEIDVSDLTERAVNGYAVTRPAPGRGIIEPLREVGFFDQVESDGQLRYPARGGAIALTLIDDDLGAHFSEEDQPPLVTTAKAQDVELPRRLRLQYIAESRDYDTGDAPSPSRITSDSVNEIDIQVPISISDDQALQSAEVLWADAWGSRWSHTIALDVSFLALDPCDVIAIPVDGRIYRARIVSIEDAAGFLRRMSLVRDDDGRYTSTAVADPPQRPRLTVIAYSMTALLLLDLPPLRDEDDNAGIYAVAYPRDPARTWSGAVIHRSIDGGLSYSQAGSVVTAGIVGQLAEALPPGLSTTWDYENVIEVDLIAGSLESRTEEAVLNGANAAAIGAHGRWEIVQFLTATQVSATRWQLSGLLRGRRATEHNVDSSAAGDYFVMLSAGGVVRLPLQTSEIGSARVYRAVTFGTSAAEATSQSFTGQGEALRPFSPVHIKGTYSVGDLLIEWTRRGRLGQELRSGADIPLSEESEAYEVDIIAPGVSPETALRTLETNTTAVTYTAAEQAADGFTSGDPIFVRVYQISATVGRGTPGDTIL
jgi:hypothetical protein